MSVKTGVDIEGISNYNPELDLTKQTVNKVNFNVNNLFVKGIDRSWTNLELNAFFSTYGKVLNTRVSSDTSNPSVNKGFGFVQFEEESSYKAVIMDSMQQKIPYLIEPYDSFKCQRKPVYNSVTEPTSIDGNFLQQFLKALCDSGFLNTLASKNIDGMDMNLN